MQQNFEKRALSLCEASEVYGPSVSTLRRAIAAGSLRAVRFGKRVLIPRDELEKMLEHGSNFEAQK